MYSQGDHPTNTEQKEQSMCVHACAQSRTTFCNPVDRRPPGSTVHGISRQDYWSGVPFPSPQNFPNPASPALAGRFFTTAHLGSHLLKKQGNLHLNTANILSNNLCFTHKFKNTRVHRK